MVGQSPPALARNIRRSRFWLAEKQRTHPTLMLCVVLVVILNLQLLVSPKVVLVKQHPVYEAGASRLPYKDWCPACGESVLCNQQMLFIVSTGRTGSTVRDIAYFVFSWFCRARELVLIRWLTYLGVLSLCFAGGNPAVFNECRVGNS